MSRDQTLWLGSALAFAALATVPLFDQGYWLALAVSMASFVAMATAWTLFSGPTHYVSLASAAFFGSGMYVVTALAEVVAGPLVLLGAALVGGALAMLAGMMTLRLSGVYFVVFTFGMSELIRQLVTWYQTTQSGTLGRYIFINISPSAIYWQLLALCALIYALGWWIARSRLGLAMRVIGDDETVARHAGIAVAAAKVVLFGLSGALIAVVGAVMAPRWTYIEPPIAFNAMISFQVVIMALLGGTRRLWGPLVGVVPFTLLYEALSRHFPNHTYLLLGLAFLFIVYALPQGVSGLIVDRWQRLRSRRAAAAGSADGASAR